MVDPSIVKKRADAKLHQLPQLYHEFRESYPKSYAVHEFDAFGIKYFNLVKGMTEFCLLERGCPIEREMPIGGLFSIAAQNRIFVGNYDMQCSSFLVNFDGGRKAASMMVQPQVLLGWAQNASNLYNSIADAHGLA